MTPASSLTGARCTAAVAAPGRSVCHPESCALERGPPRAPRPMRAAPAGSWRCVDPAEEGETRSVAREMLSTGWRPSTRRRAHSAVRSLVARWVRTTYILCSFVTTHFTVHETLDASSHSTSAALTTRRRPRMPQRRAMAPPPRRGGSARTAGSAHAAPPSPRVSHLQLARTVSSPSQICAHTCTYAAHRGGGRAPRGQHHRKGPRYLSGALCTQCS